MKAMKITPQGALFVANRWKESKKSVLKEHSHFFACTFSRNISEILKCFIITVRYYACVNYRKDWSLRKDSHTLCNGRFPARSSLSTVTCYFLNSVCTSKRGPICILSVIPSGLWLSAINYPKVCSILTILFSFSCFSLKVSWFYNVLMKN